MPTPSAELVESMELHARSAHAESPHRYGAGVADVLSLAVLQQGALIVESTLAQYAGPTVDAFIAAHHDEIAAWFAPKLADVVKGLADQFATKAAQSGAGR